MNSFQLQPMTVSGNQIIINLPEADGHVPLKAVECVYNVAVNYSSSSVNIMTGPPGVMGMRDAQVSQLLPGGAAVSSGSSARSLTTKTPSPAPSPICSVAGTCM